jgi:D-3-phosphoglycerate dehydrogenase / 2-oxoglutarate reductase
MNTRKVKILISDGLAKEGVDLLRAQSGFEIDLFIHPKVVCVPHLGAATYEAKERVALTAAKQIVEFFTKRQS